MKTKPENVKRPPEVAAAMRARAASFRRRPWQERKEIVLRIVDRIMWEMSGVMPESCRADVVAETFAIMMDGGEVDIPFERGMLDGPDGVYPGYGKWKMGKDGEPRLIKSPKPKDDPKD